MPIEIWKLALVHVNNDRVEAAYRRRTLMQQWADHLAATGRALGRSCAVLVMPRPAT